MRFLVTGATGFIGRALAASLAADPQHNVAILVRDRYRSQPLPEPLNSLTDRLVVVYADLREYHETRRAVQAQVRNGYRGVLATISRVRALEATQVSAKSALEATEAGFEVGTRTLVDVLNSQRELFRAKRDLAVSRYGYVLNMLSLLQAAGTLGTDNVQAANAWMQ